jgi:hypothetical protein
MSSCIAKYVKAEGERKRYQIDYTNWLDTGEAVLSVVFTVNNQSATKLLVLDGVQVLPTSLGVQYYISGGLDTTQYSVTATMTTTTGPQIREDEIIVNVKGT